MYWLIAVLLGAVMFVLVLRFIQSGANAPRLIQMTTSALALLAIALPRVMGENLRFLLSILALLSVAVLGVLQFGLAAPAAPILIIVPLLVATIYERRAAFAVLALELVFLGGAGLAFSRQMIMVPFGVGEYSAKLANWAFLMIAVGVLSALAVVIMVRLRRHWATALANLTAAHRDIRHQAETDMLTGLMNRKGHIDRLSRQIATAQRAGQTPLALVLFDLDLFKRVNDRLGHSAGDEVLRAIARRIRDLLPEKVHFARLAGDEFTLLFAGETAREDAHDIAQEITAALQTPIRAGPDTVPVSASVGIACFPQDATTIDGLMRAADLAMYEAKNERATSGGVFYTPDLGQRLTERSQLISEIPEGLARGEFVLHYQPIVGLESGAIHKAEALVRWNHPRLGLLAPDRFIPLAEEALICTAIDDWVLEQVKADMPAIQGRFGPDFRIATNVSPTRFATSNSQQLAEWVAQFADARARGQNIIIEFTESALLRLDSEVREGLTSIRSEKFQIALDDFGAGNSSLIYLLDQEFDYIKIDRAITAKLPEHARARAVLEFIMSFSGKLGAKIVAEGIETPGQLQALRAAGCAFGQGFLFSPPRPLEEFLAAVPPATPPSAPPAAIPPASARHAEGTG